MGAIFSKKNKKKSRVTETDKQILALKLQRDQLIVFRRKLEMQYKQAEDAAKSLLKENKKQLALLALKRRKQQQELIHQAEEHMLQVNQLISNVEMASMQADIVKALEAGNSALKSIQAEISVNYVESLLSESAELQSSVADVTEALTGVQTEDPDVFHEYERLEAEVALDKTEKIPQVPTTAIPEVAGTKKEELAAAEKDESVAQLEPA